MELTETDSNYIKNYIDNRSFSRSLVVLRAKNNLTQAEMANKINKSMRWIVSFENKSNDKIKLNDAQQYLNCLGYKISIEKA